MAMDELGATERVSLSDGVKGGKWEGWGKKVCGRAATEMGLAEVAHPGLGLVMNPKPGLDIALTVSLPLPDPRGGGQCWHTS